MLTSPDVDLVVADGLPAPRWMTVEGVRTCYFEAGAGEPVILIHGGNFGAFEASVSSSCWSCNVAPLAERFHVVAFDKLGQGYTDPPARDEDYTMAAVVRHAAAFIAALGLPPVHVVGHSRGAFAAVRIALEHPALVRSVTIVSSSTLMPLVATNESTLSPCPFPPMSREAARWVYQNYSFDPTTVPEGWVEMSFASTSSPGYRQAVSKMFEQGLKASLFIPELARQKRETLAMLEAGLLQRPVQIFWGYNDRTSTYEGGFTLFDTISRHERRTSFRILNKAGHFVFAEQPDLFNAHLAGFVAAAAAE